jgi:hypothetical protein
MNALEDVWLSAADKEYDALLRRDRGIGADVGDLFCVFASVVRRGAVGLGPSSEVCGSSDLYIRHRGRVMMCFALCGGRVAIVKWAELGTEAQQRRALDEAKTRAMQLFPVAAAR